MSNIIEDAFQDVEIKPRKSKIILKLIVRISLILISTAFVFGQFRVNYYNRMKSIEKSIEINSADITKTNEKIYKGFNDINNRIDDVYFNGINSFIEYNDYNKKQLELIIDYSDKTDKTLLKKMLELNAIEKNKNVENQLNKAIRN
jgi:hypothetical protein